MYRSVLFFFLFLFLVFSCRKKENNSQVNPSPEVIKDEIFADNLVHPWEILWGPDNMIWMTERGGRISRVNPVNGNISLLHTISEVVSTGEGGLLGMVLHPDFSNHPYVYTSYNYLQSGIYQEKIVRFTYNGSMLTEPFTLFDGIAASNIHNGSRLLITPDLKLLITTGDASNTSRSQNLSSPNGKVLRLNLDGSIPADNPVPGNPVWSHGHRNPQGMVMANGILYISEHGPSTDDEVNIIEKGRNYGWPDVRGFCNETAEQIYCTSNNIMEPLQSWTPTIAPAGMDYYNHNQIPQWKNSLLLTTLKNARLYQIKLNPDYRTVNEVNELFTGKYGRLRDICISPDGKIYICTSNGSNDKIIVVQKN